MSIQLRSSSVEKTSLDLHSRSTGTQGLKDTFLSPAREPPYIRNVIPNGLGANAYTKAHLTRTALPYRQQTFVQGSIGHCKPRCCCYDSRWESQYYNHIFLIGLRRLESDQCGTASWAGRGNRPNRAPNSRSRRP